VVERKSGDLPGKTPIDNAKSRALPCSARERAASKLYSANHRIVHRQQARRAEAYPFRQRCRAVTVVRQITTTDVSCGANKLDHSVGADHQYDNQSVEPSQEAKGRLSNLITMLHAYSGVVAKVDGYTRPTSDKAADKRLTKARACRVTQILRDGGIAPARLTCEGLEGATSAPGDELPADERVTITFTIPSESPAG